MVASRFHIDVTAYHNVYDQLVSNRLVMVAPPPHTLFRFPFANGVEGTADGGEIAADWNATPWWRLGAAFARVVVDAENKPGDVDVSAVRRYEGTAPRNQSHVQSSLNLPRGVQLDTTYRYVGALRSLAIAPYHTGDIRIAWRASPGVELSLSGRDLFSPGHLEFPHSPGPNVGIRRSIFAAIAWVGEPDSTP